MYNIKKANKGFDGIRCSMQAYEFDRVMFCLENAIYELDTNTSDLLDKLLLAGKKLQQVLSTMAYFDVDNEEVHVQLGYKELGTLTTIITMFELPSGDSEYSFAKCIEKNTCKKWVSKIV